MDSGGGDFYAMSDEQLQRLLAGQLDHAQFLHDGASEQPRERFAGANAVWYELSQVLQPEAGCGAEQTTMIPAMSGYSYSKQVAATATQLAALPEAEVRKRCEGAIMEASAEQVLAAIRQLAEFYRRAADRQEAILFRVT